MKKKTQLIIFEILTAIMFVFVMFPFLIVLFNSAKDNLMITNAPASLPSDWGSLFVNVKEIWNNDIIRYPSSLLSSLIITLGSLAAISVFSSMAAWKLVRTKTKSSTFIFLLFLSGLIIPFQVVMFPLVKFLNNLQGIIGIPILYTHGGMIFTYIGFGAPLAVFMFHGFIKSIPVALEEAATIDGCTTPQVYTNVIMPILKPIFVTVIILNVIWIWNDFLLPLLILGIGNDVQTLPLAIAFFAGAFRIQWNLMMTAVLMAAVPIVILFLFAQKHIIKGMVAGSIK